MTAIKSVYRESLLNNKYDFPKELGIEPNYQNYEEFQCREEIVHEEC